MLRRPLRFATRALLLQVGVLLLVGSAGLVLMGLLLHDNLTDQYEQRALAIARAVAADPTVAREVAAGEPGGELQVRAEAVRLRTGALFVVVADVRGIRYTHPNPSNIGKPVSTDPSVVSPAARSSASSAARWGCPREARSRCATTAASSSAR